MGTIILAYVIYKIMAWIKNTKAWSLLKGITVIAVFLLIAYILQLRTILWVSQRMLGVVIIALVILFQPELRHALERLGQRRIFSGFRGGGKGYERFSKSVANEIVDAAFDMGRAKTGALIVIEQNQKLDEYLKTGIRIDAELTSQLLINIFEHNTPLHDGAVVISDNKIAAAACMLPLASDTDIAKELGTRHRAAIGISKESDAIAVVVSEETGKISVAKDGTLIADVREDVLKKILISNVVTKRFSEKDNVINERFSKIKGIFKKKEKVINNNISNDK